MKVHGDKQALETSASTTSLLVTRHPFLNLGFHQNRVAGFPGLTRVSAVRRLPP